MCTFFSQKLTAALLESLEGENDPRKYFIIHERLLPTRQWLNPQPPDHQSDAHPTEPPRLHGALWQGRITRGQNFNVNRYLLTLTIDASLITKSMIVPEKSVFSFFPIQKHERPNLILPKIGKGELVFWVSFKWCYTQNIAIMNYTKKDSCVLYIFSFEHCLRCILVSESKERKISKS